MAQTQLYVIEGPDGWLHVEMWEDGQNLGLIPAPYANSRLAEYLDVLAKLNPGALIDVCDGTERDEILADAGVTR